MVSCLILLLVVSLSYASETNEVVNANNLFTASICKQLLDGKSDNLIVSPFSIEAILSLAQTGAKGETGREIRSALHLPENQDEIEEGFKSVAESLTSTKQIHFHAANKIYVRNGVSIKTDFKNAATSVFKCGIENVNFGEATEIINNWVEEETHKKITNFIDPNSLDPLTEAILVNAVHFKGDFQIPFTKSKTTKNPFFGPTGAKLAETMINIGRYGYLEIQDLGLQMLKLDFKGNDASLVIVLPDIKFGLKLSPLKSHLDTIFASHTFSYESVKVQLPKFKIEGALVLKPYLQNLGINKAFSDAGADFSGMAGEKGEIHINEVIQKAYIDVSEGGVDAGAVTSVNVKGRSAVIDDFNKTFSADRSFVFYLQIKNVIMFAGMVTDP